MPKVGANFIAHTIIQMANFDFLLWPIIQRRGWQGTHCKQTLSFAQEYLRFKETKPHLANILFENSPQFGPTSYRKIRSFVKRGFERSGVFDFSHFAFVYIVIQRPTVSALAQTQTCAANPTYHYRTHHMPFDETLKLILQQCVVVYCGRGGLLSLKTRGLKRPSRSS